MRRAVAGEDDCPPGICDLAGGSRSTEMNGARTEEQDEAARSPNIITRRDNPFLRASDGGSGSSDDSDEEPRVPDVERDDLAARRALRPRGPASAGAAAVAPHRRFLPTPRTEYDVRHRSAVAQASRCNGASRQRSPCSSPPQGLSPTWGPTPQLPGPTSLSPKIVTRRENAFLSPARDDDGGGDDDEEDDEERDKVPDLRRDDMTARRVTASLPVACPAVAFNRFLPNPAARRAQCRPARAAVPSRPRRERGAAATASVSAVAAAHRKQLQQKGPTEGLLLFAEKVHVDPMEPALRVEPLESSAANDDGTKSLTDVAGEGGNRSSILLHYEELQKIRGAGKEQEEQWQDDLARWKNRRRSTSGSLKRLSMASDTEGLGPEVREIRTYAQMMHNREDRARDRENGYRDRLSGPDDVFSSAHGDTDSSLGPADDSVHSSYGRASAGGDSAADPLVALRPVASAEPPITSPRRFVAEKESPSPPPQLQWPDSLDGERDGGSAPPGPAGLPRTPVARGPEGLIRKEPPCSVTAAAAATTTVTSLDILTLEENSSEKPLLRPNRIPETKIAHDSVAVEPVALGDGRTVEPIVGPVGGPQPWSVTQRVRPGVSGVRVLPVTAPRPFSAAPRSVQSLPRTYKAENMLKTEPPTNGLRAVGSLPRSDSGGDPQDRWGSSEELSDTESERAAEPPSRPLEKAPPEESEPLVQFAQTSQSTFAAPPAQASVAGSLWDDERGDKELQGDAGHNGTSNPDSVSISRKNQMRRSEFFGLPAVESAELPAPLLPVPLWSETPPVPALRTRAIEPDTTEADRRQDEERRRKREQEEIERRRQEEEEEARRRQAEEEEEEEERRRQREAEEQRKRRAEQDRLRLEREQEQRRQRAAEEARRRAAAEEEDTRKWEEEAAAAERKRRKEEEAERQRQEEQAAGARGSARAWTQVHTETDARAQHKPVSVQRATGNLAQKLLEEANTQRLSVLGGPPMARPTAGGPDKAALDEERRQIVQQMKHPNPARARGSFVFKEPALAREEARTNSQAEKERQRILQELKKPAVVTSDASWIRNRGKAGGAAGGGAGEGWKRNSGVELRTKRSSTLGGDRSWIRHSLALGEMEHDRASAIASELSHVRRQCDDMGLRPTGMTDGPTSWQRSAPVSPEPPPDRSASSKKQCWGCQSSVGKGAAMFIESLNVYFHLDCFKCGVCGGGLTTMGSGVDVRLRSGRLHCNECFTRAADC